MPLLGRARSAASGVRINMVARVHSRSLRHKVQRSSEAAAQPSESNAPMPGAYRLLRASCGTYDEIVHVYIDWLFDDESEGECNGVRRD